MVVRSSIISGILCFALSACATPNGQTQLASNTEELDGVSAEMADEVLVERGSDILNEGVDRDRILCKRTVVTGTRFAKRYCAPLWKWQQMRDQSRQVGDEIQRRRITGREN